MSATAMMARGDADYLPEVSRLAAPCPGLRQGTKEDRVLQKIFVGIVLHATISLNLPVTDAAGAEVTVKTTLPASRIPARDNPDPPCGDPNAVTGADVVLAALGAAADSYIGAPVTSAAIQATPGLPGWLSARLGIFPSGPSTCQTLCVAVPADVQAAFQSCFTILEGNGVNSGLRCFPVVPSMNPSTVNMTHNWGSVQNATVATRGRTRLFCALGKNHSHDQSRDFQLRVIY